MPILLNRDGVSAEVMELARLKISKALSIPLQAIRAKWEIHEGRMIPAFDIDTESNEVKKALAVSEESGHKVDEESIRLAMGAVWRWLKSSLDERLHGLSQRRG